MQKKIRGNSSKKVTKPYLVYLEDAINANVLLLAAVGIGSGVSEYSGLPFMMVERFPEGAVYIDKIIVSDVLTMTDAEGDYMGWVINKTVEMRTTGNKLLSFIVLILLIAIFIMFYLSLLP